MGEAVTEGGAISAAAAFFRQHMDSCAWAEDPTPKAGTRSQGAPPLLRFPLHPKHRGVGFANDGAAGAALPFRSPRGEGGRANELLELVVSRGAGPAFSEDEARAAELAAVLLSQALGRIRDGAALAEARAALEDSLRIIEEASDAVAVLVEERDRRGQQEARKAAELEEKHGEAMSGARDALERARCDADELRGRLVEAGESLAAIANAAEEACRIVSADGDDADRTDEVVAVIERAARSALPCSSAWVARRCSASSEPDPVGVEERKEEGSVGDTASCLTRNKSGDEAVAAQELRVPVPCHGGSAEPLILSVRGASSPLRRFTQRDRTAASALAACLCAALLAMREKKRARRLLRQAEADEEARAKRRAAAAAAAAAAEAEAQKRGERAVAGMRALVVEAQASKAKAGVAAVATRRAERHAEALGHLLLGLSKAGSDYAAVARAVYRRASAAVPGCVGAVLLTPRRHRRGAGGASGLFSPDPRAWATAAASSRGEGVGSSERERERDEQGPSASGPRWAERVQRSAAQAAATGKTVVCVLDGNKAGLPRGGRRDSLSSRVVCFSPVLASEASGAERQASASPTAFSDRMRTAELEGGETTRVSGGNPCLVGWMLRVGDDGDSPETSSAAPAAAAAAAAATAAVSPLTESVMSDADAEGVAFASPAAVPTRVSNAINAVVHAVGLALSACTAAADAAAFRRRASPPSIQPTGRPPSSRRGRDAQEGARDAGGLSAESTPRRDLELRRLRAGTATLAERVEELEERAAGLCASEARSAAALARARADAGAARGELQLAALELERERRKPLAAARWTGNLSAGRDGGGEALLGASRSIPGLAGGVAGFGSRPKRHGGGKSTGVFVGPPGSTVFSTSAGSQGPTPSPGLEGVKEEGQAGAGPAAGVLERVVLPESPLPAPLGAASSAALQRMASVHARLANSLKNGTFSGSITRGGTAPAVGVA